MGRILLCADTESLVRPMLIGLEDTNLGGHGWLESISDARAARERIVAQGDIDEAWVVATDEVAGINLVAALRSDSPRLPVCLVAFEPGDELREKAAKAGATAVWDIPAFCARYDTEVRRRSLMSEVMTLDIDELMEEAVDRRSAQKGHTSEVQQKTAPPSPASRMPMAPPRASVAQVPQSYQAFSSSQTGRLPKVPAQGRPEGRAFVVSFLSGSGGVGKSTASAVTAFMAAAKGFSTVVLDCDLQFGDMHTMMGAKRSATVDEVLIDHSALSLLAEQASKGVPALVCAPDRLERSELLSQHLEELIDACACFFDVVVVNTGSSWADVHAQLLERSSCSVFMIDQRASSVRSCQHALELCLRLGIATGSFVYALNRCRRGALFNAVDISNVMQGAQVFELKEGGAEVEELLGAGLAAELVSGKNDFCASISEMLDEILPSNGSFFKGAGQGARTHADGTAGFVMPEARNKRRGRGRKQQKDGSARPEATMIVGAGAGSRRA